MYHAIGEPGERASRFVVPIAAFARQMRALAALPLDVVALDEALATLHGGHALRRRSVALTFDDGTRDLALLGRPVLERHGFPATAFVVTGAMGSTVDWTDHADLARRRIMTWEEALDLQPRVAIQPHTRTHPSLRELGDAALTDEIAGSRDDVEMRTGARPTTFAYPYGHYDQRVAAAAAAAGFTAACTVKPGLNDGTTPAHELRRHEVRGDLSFRGFLSLLLGRA
jgi:peptidoglycan/xylan/chitin deacetylase (PgdA/CDA1 family)